MTTSDFKKGMVIIFQGEPYRIVEFQHVNPGKGSAFVRTKMRSIKLPKQIEFTFKAGETIELADMQTMNAQYLYAQDGQYWFMITDNYEQYSLDAETLGEKVKYFKEQMEVMIVMLDGSPLDIQLPAKMIFEVTEAPPGVRGDTATTVTKEVTIETGATVRVPGFVNAGDKIRINTETGAYDTRV